MMNNLKTLKAEKGFTLIELMIVVAIIGILAAIAIPQFQQYRIKAMNDTALADLRNASTAEEAINSAWNSFGSTQSNILLVSPKVRPAAIVAGVMLDPRNVAADGIAATETQAGGAMMVAAATDAEGFAISNGVNLIADASGNGFPAGGAFIKSKHFDATRTFTYDTDGSSIYFCDGGEQDRQTALDAQVQCVTGGEVNTTGMDVNTAAPWTTL